MDKNSSHKNEPGNGGINPYKTEAAAKKEAKRIVAKAVTKVNPNYY
jgi:hypothetical protein